MAATFGIVSEPQAFTANSASRTLVIRWVSIKQSTVGRICETDKILARNASVMDDENDDDERAWNESKEPESQWLGTRQELAKVQCHTILNSKLQNSQSPLRSLVWA